MLRFAANLSWMYGEHAFLDRFAAAARDGFTGVELLFPYEHAPEDLASRLQSHKLTQVLFNAPPGNFQAGERGLAALPGREEEFRQSIHTALRYAHALNCKSIHVMSGIQSAEAQPTYEANLAWAAKFAQEADVTLLIEPINHRDMPGYFLSRQQQAHDVVEKIASPALKVQMDLYHCQIAEGDISIKLQKYLSPESGSKVGHLQIAGVPGRNEPDDSELDYGFILRKIADLNYQGWIGCEYRPKGKTSAGLGWLRKWQ